MIIKDDPRRREKTLENLLTYFSLAEEDSEWKDIARPDFRVPLTDFDGADVWCYESLMGLTKSHEQLFFPPEDPDLHSAKFLGWNSTILHWDEAEKHVTAEYNKEYMWGLWNVRSVAPREIRGKFNSVAGQSVQVKWATLHKDGTYHSGSSFLDWRPPRWYILAAGQMPLERPELWSTGESPEEIEDEERAIWMHKSIYVTKCYEWRVKLKLGESLPGLCITVDPAGAREVFKLRDIPPGKTRRDALRHWVSQYMRSSIGKDGEVRETEVLPYLRGAVKFSHSGLTCEVLPSEYDLNRARRYEQLRKAKVSMAGGKRLV